MTGTIITRKGVALIAKLLATEQQLTFTRAAVGTGSCPSGYDPASMLDLNQYHMDGTISGFKAEGEEATVTFQISSETFTEGFVITEAGVYAEDVDEGEILYAYLDLTGDPQYVYPKGGVVQKFAEIDFKTIVGQVKSVTATISPSSLVTREAYDAGMAAKVTAEGGDIADTTVSAYTAVTEEYPEPKAGDTMTTIIGKVVKFIRDAKTGFCKKAELVDNCTSTATDKAPTANQAKVLWDKITAAVTALTTHKSSGDHDGRYYTETEVNNLLAAKVSKSDLVNNATSAATDKAPTANQVKVLNDRINALNGESSGNATINTTYVNKISTTYVKWRKLGRLVTVEVYDIILKAGCNTYDVAVIATGLPAPKGGGFNASVTGNKPSTNETAIARLYVNANGVLKPWYIGNPSIETGMNGSFSYISAS